MVSHYLTIKLIGREHIPGRKTFHHQTCVKWSYPVLITVSGGYPKAKGRLLTCYSPVRRSSTTEVAFPLDLHVLSTPPAFVLSQDQTLHRKIDTQPTPQRSKAERQSIRATSPDRTKLTVVRIIVQRNPRHQHPHPNHKSQDTSNVDVNGAKQTNSSTNQTHC